MFWIVCVDAMRNSDPNPWILSPIVFGSICSFSVAIAISVLSAANPQPHGAWPSPSVCELRWKQWKSLWPLSGVLDCVWPSRVLSLLPHSPAILLRIVLSLDLAVDLSILLIMLAELRRMRKEFEHLKKTFSTLTYIFIGVATLSTCLIIAELIINVPQSVSWLASNDFTGTACFPGSEGWLQIFHSQ